MPARIASRRRWAQMRVVSRRCSTAIFRKYSVKVIRLAEGAQSGNSIPRTVLLYVPPGAFVGHDALDKFAGDLRATHPHYVYTPHGSPQVLHNSGRLAWGSGAKGEPPSYTGVDFIIARDGKIATLYVYLDSPAT